MNQQMVFLSDDRYRGVVLVGFLFPFTLSPSSTSPVPAALRRMDRLIEGQCLPLVLIYTRQKTQHLFTMTGRFHASEHLGDLTFRVDDKGVTCR